MLCNRNHLSNSFMESGERYGMGMKCDTHKNVLICPHKHPMRILHWVFSCHWICVSKPEDAEWHFYRPFMNFNYLMDWPLDPMSRLAWGVWPKAGLESPCHIYFWVSLSIALLRSQSEKENLYPHNVLGQCMCVLVYILLRNNYTIKKDLKNYPMGMIAECEWRTTLNLLDSFSNCTWVILTCQVNGDVISWLKYIPFTFLLAF